MYCWTDTRVLTYGVARPGRGRTEGLQGALPAMLLHVLKHPQC